MNKNKLVKIVETLQNKYEKNELIMNKLNEYIENLPNLLSSLNTTIIEKQKRKQKLEKESEKFIKKFLNNNKFYYHNSSELFFQYENNNYNIIKEDDIQYTILTNISKNTNLTDWKHKLKVSLLKKIKDRDIFNCIPDSETIQKLILNLNIILKTKSNTKYFLTIIGDILLKKTNPIYILNPKIKQFIKELNNQSCMYFGSVNLLNIFKFKYYDHNISECRLIDINDSINMDYWNSFLKSEKVINLFCVAAYYSRRYENADNYLLNNCKDESLINYAHYLKNNNEEQIIDLFIKKTIIKEKNSDDLELEISWKNMQFLWKEFIENEKLPNIFFINQLKNILFNKLEYNNEKDAFINITSKNLPTVSKFLKFWNEQIIIDENVNDELEIDEITSLFSHSYKINSTDKSVMDLIKHFFPNTFIDEDKYILNATCHLWNKKEHINNFLKKYKLVLQKNHDEDFEIHVNDLYEEYCKKKDKFIVSKKYFVNFITDESNIEILDDNFINIKSLEFI
jgi:hypothetical protein